METHLKHEYFQYAVYPDSERMDLGENELSAIFRYKEHAETFGKNMWGKFYIIEPIICDKFYK